MNGRILAGGLVVFALLFAGVLYYMQNYAFYDRFQTDTLQIAGRDYAVTGFQGIDAATSPLKLRGCFRLAGPVAAPLVPKPVPLVAPGWFECFDAGALTADIASGAAVAYLAAAEEADGVDRVVALYPDGRGYVWRQLNAKFAQ